MNKMKWWFSVVEEAILNEDFIKEHPNYAGGRIEIWNDDYPYDVAEIRLLLPQEIFDKIREAIDSKEVDYFVIDGVSSEELEEELNRLEARNEHKRLD